MKLKGAHRPRAWETQGGEAHQQHHQAAPAPAAAGAAAPAEGAEAALVAAAAAAAAAAAEKEGSKQKETPQQAFARLQVQGKEAGRLLGLPGDCVGHRDCEWGRGAGMQAPLHEGRGQVNKAAEFHQPFENS